MINVDQKIFIRDKRKQGFSYKRIYELSGIRRSYISEYSNLIGKGILVSLAVIKANRKTGDKLRKPEETFMCKACGKSFIRNPKRHSGQGKDYCSRECAFDDYGAWSTHSINPVLNKPYESCSVSFPNCVVCGNAFMSRNGKITCSDGCKSINYIELRKKHAPTRRLYDRKRQIEYREAHPIILKEKECPGCGDLFITKYDYKTHCSKKCKKKRERSNRRAAIRGAFVEPVDIAILFKRDAGRCRLCNRKLNLKREVPHPLAITVDHIIPLSKGGMHEYKNTQLSCFKCNYTKNNGVARGGEQLLICGM